MTKLVSIIQSHIQAIEQIPSTLDLYEGLSGPGNCDILKIAALHLELDTGGGDERPGPQDGIDGPTLLHGLCLRCQLDQSFKLRTRRVHTAADESGEKEGAKLG
jgi:hypothetical protein